MGFGGSGGSGGGAIANATDVGLDNPANNQVLTFDGATAKWKNAAAPSGTGSGTSILFIDMTSGSYTPPASLPANTKLIVFRGPVQATTANITGGTMPAYVGTGANQAVAEYWYDPRFV